MFTNTETQNATSVTQTGDAQTNKVRRFINFYFDEVVGKCQQLKTSLVQSDNEMMLSFSSEKFFTTFHIQEIGNTPIPDAIQLSFPFAQEGGAR